MTSMQEGMFWKTSGNIQKAQIGSFADSHLFIHGTNSTWKMDAIVTERQVNYRHSITNT